MSPSSPAWMAAAGTIPLCFLPGPLPLAGWCAHPLWPQPLPRPHRHPDPRAPRLSESEPATGEIPRCWEAGTGLQLADPRTLVSHLICCSQEWTCPLLPEWRQARARVAYSSSQHLHSFPAGVSIWAPHHQTARSPPQWPVTMVPPLLKMCHGCRVALFSFCPSSLIWRQKRERFHFKIPLMVGVSLA